MEYGQPVWNMEYGVWSMEYSILHHLFHPRMDRKPDTGWSSGTQPFRIKQGPSRKPMAQRNCHGRRQPVLGRDSDLHRRFCRSSRQNRHQARVRGHSPSRLHGAGRRQGRAPRPGDWGRFGIACGRSNQKRGRPRRMGSPTMLRLGSDGVFNRRRCQVKGRGQYFSRGTVRKGWNCRHREHRRAIIVAFVALKDRLTTMRWPYP